MNPAINQRRSAPVLHCQRATYFAHDCKHAARVVADLLQRSQDGLVCVLPAARMLLAGVDVIPVHVIAWADKLL